MGKIRKTTTKFLPHIIEKHQTVILNTLKLTKTDKTLYIFFPSNLHQNLLDSLFKTILNRCTDNNKLFEGAK